tara:strand:- start:13591 stop:15213 length:1623 start_codon:yes stop_codon:yes gene_type:complete
MKHIFFLFLLIPFVLFSQNKYTFSFGGDVRISKIQEGKNGLLLLAGKYGFEKINEDSDQIFQPFLYTYNRATQDTNNLLANWPVNRGQVVDLITTKSGDYIVLINLYDKEQDSEDFALITISPSLNIIGIEMFDSSKYRLMNKIYAQGLYELKTGEMVVSGSLYNDWATSNYLAIKGLDNVWREDTTGRESYFQYSGLNGTDDIIETNDNLIVFSENIPLSLRPQWYSKDSLLLNSTLHFEKDDSNYVRRNDFQNNSTPNYSIYSMNHVTAINSEHFISSCLSHTGRTVTEWISPDTILTTNYDTIDFALYSFDQNLDSLNLISLTDEFPFPFNGPGAIASLKDNRICVGVTLNNLYSKNPDLLKTHFYNDTINEYPLSKENKILVALLDNSGNTLWSQVLDSGNEFEMINDAVPSKNGGCLLAGSTFSPENENLHNPLIIEIDSIGYLGVVDLNKNNHSQIFPNPAQSQGNVNLSWSGMEKQSWIVKFYDNKGRLVHETDILQGVSETHLQLPELQRGNYIIRAEGSGKQVHTGTLVVD